MNKQQRPFSAISTTNLETTLKQLPLDITRVQELLESFSEQDVTGPYCRSKLAAILLRLTEFQAVVLSELALR